MSIRKDVTVKITNNNATLDMPLQIYELDHGIELRFKLMDYKYKYTKDPQNILNSSDEDILEAYTTIINPRGYELQQINGEVKDDIVIFVIDSSYTDEIDEIGTYKLQIHIKCACSEFSIPPIQFEVLQRLKGIKVATDGEDEVDNSEIVDGSSKFVSDETGKLIIEWKKGDTISSAKLNAMVDVINNAVDEEAQRQLNEAKREQQELEREQQELERQNELQEALDSVDARVDESMIEYETRFNALTASQQQDMEVIDARDGEVSLKARLDRDFRNPLQVYEDVEDSYISCDSTEGYAQNVEILGNTVQDADNLADIRSVGDKLENQELYEIPVLSCGKNLININSKNISISTSNENDKVVYTIEDDFLVVKSNGSYSWGFVALRNIKVKPNTTYILTPNATVVKGDVSVWVYDNSNNKLFETANKSKTFTTNDLTTSVSIRFYCQTTTAYTDACIKYKAQLEEGTQATSYEPYQEQKITILSPVQLEKVGDVADRIICKDGVWGVEKNIETYTFQGNELNAQQGTVTREDGVIIYKYFWIDANLTLNNKNNYKKLLCSCIAYSLAGNLNSKGDIAMSFNGGGTNLLVDVPHDTRSLANEFLKGNYIIYALETPTFIPLPHDQQIKLRTFASKTNISFLTEIEGTIKAQIPQSMSATINTHTEQIGNLNKELNRVMKLEESVASTVTTESSFTTVEATSNGYFDNVNLEGKTLVNLAITTEFNVPNRTVDINLPIKENCEYTVYGDFKNAGTRDYSVLCCTSSVYLDSKPSTGDSLYLDSVQGGVGSEWRIYYDTDECIKIISKTGEKYMHIRTGGNETGLVYSNLVILEGDYTQNPPSFFEGIKSVGQDVDDITIATTNAPMFFGKGGKK